MEGRIKKNHFREFQLALRYEIGTVDTATTFEMAMVLLATQENTIPSCQQRMA
jgi:hypothetical protein